MENMNQRLDKLKQTIQDQDFLKGNGLSNEVNIRMFCYEAKDEMTIRYFIEHLQDTQLQCNPTIINIYQVFLKLCENSRMLDKLPNLEKSKGHEFLQEHFETRYDGGKYAEEIMKEFPEDGDVLILTGIGEAFPFMRVHVLLNALQDYTEKPIVAMYPGVFDGHYVKLFNLLNPNPYYRAFNEI